MSGKTLRRNRKIDGDALEPDLFAQIAGLDLAAFPDLDRGDIGADSADIVGDRSASNARASSAARTTAASDKSVDQPFAAVR